MTLIWIAIAAITGYWVYREYGELLKVKTSHYAEDDKSRRLEAFSYMAENARRNIAIVDYRREVDDSLYENDDIVRMLTRSVERNDKLRIEIATAHSRDCWLMDHAALPAGTTMMPGAVIPSGQALVMLMDDGAMAYTVNSWGSTKVYDCREVSQNTRDLTLGAHLGAITEIFRRPKQEDERAPGYENQEDGRGRGRPIRGTQSRLPTSRLPTEDNPGARRVRRNAPGS